MKIYVTKHCLTQGIQEREAEIDGSMATLKNAGHLRTIHGEGIDWHLTKEAAIERAEEVRIKKLQSLDKQTKKISAIVFD